MAANTSSTTKRRFRLLPSRLGSRLVVTNIVVALVVFGAISAIVMALLAYHTRALALQDAERDFEQIRFQLQLQARELDSFVVAFSEWNEFYDQTLQTDPAFVTAEFDPWLAERAAATVVAWVRADGTVIHTSGSTADVEALLALVPSDRERLSGLASLPSGPSLVAIGRIVGDPVRDPIGIVVVARPVNEDLLYANGTARVLPPPDTGTPLDESWREVEAPPGFGVMASRVQSGDFVTRAEIRGVDGRPAVLIELAQNDPWLGDDRVWLVILLPIVLGLATVGVGVAVALMLNRRIGRPVADFVDYLQDQGYLALQGLRVDQDLLVDERIPEDFQELGHVIVDLMTQLRINQAELIEAGEAALAAERAFRTVVEESPEVKLLVRGGVVEIANPAAAHFFGLRLGDLVRAEPEGLFTGIGLYSEEGVRVDIRTIAGEAVDGPVVVRCTVPNQPDRWVEMSVAVMDVDGRDYVISARNVTEERRLEALREEILSLVSHDLRSPLTVVRGYLDILEKPIDDERRETAAQAGRRAAERMEGLLDDLLYATRAERVFAPTVMRAVDLGLLAHGVASSLQMTAEQTITVSAEDDVFVLGDAVRLEQAVTNLVGNAIKFSPAEGKVLITVDAYGDRARIAVEDDGPGVSEDQRETVFERGTRGRGSDATPGSGLGLYIVRVVAEAHGGTALVESAPKGGARFVLDLPRAQDDGD